VEGNRRLLADQKFHFGLPPGILGRRTGYYMDAVEGDPQAFGRAYTAYLVSIFRTAKQARTAYDVRWDTWFAADFYTSPQPAPIKVGDKGREALFHSFDPSSPPESELMFLRGRVLVEVFQGTSGATATSEQTQAFYTIATKLDALAASHPTGA
jgi:hypothetical protein